MELVRLTFGFVVALAFAAMVAATLMHQVVRTKNAMITICIAMFASALCALFLISFCEDRLLRDLIANRNVAIDPDRLEFAMMADWFQTVVVAALCGTFAGLCIAFEYYRKLKKHVRLHGQLTVQSCSGEVRLPAADDGESEYSLIRLETFRSN